MLYILKTRIVIIGCGNVGLAYLKRLCLENLNLEIIIIDLNQDHLQGEILDLESSLVYRPNNITIRFGNYNDCDTADIIVITAGVKQSNNDRLKDLNEANEIILDITNHLKDTSFKGIYLVATNPLDVITELVARYTDHDYNKVIGTGTMLDTARLKNLISKKIQVRPNDINVYVLGEHGNSQFVAWSNANIGLENLSHYLSQEEKEALEYETRKMGSAIVKSKGYTSDGVASSLVALTLAICNDLKCIYPVSNYNIEYDVFISTPVVIGKEGIVKNINIKLTEQEEQKLKESSEIISDALATILPRELY